MFLIVIQTAGVDKGYTYVFAGFLTAKGIKLLLIHRLDLDTSSDLS